jgi:hypothetical protein
VGRNAATLSAPTIDTRPWAAEGPAVPCIRHRLTLRCRVLGFPPLRRKITVGNHARSTGRGLLIAVLLNRPKSTSGARTRNAVAAAARVLKYESVEVVNLYSEATSSISDLNRSATIDGWLRARSELSSALGRATGVLGGWGVAGLTGPALRGQNEQVAWLRLEAIRAGVSAIWMVGGEPRHPSRWHQFVSDKYGRTTGGSLEERLDQVLGSVPITSSATTGCRDKGQAQCR